MQLFGLDRPDLQYAAKEACREMAHPKVSSLRKLKRMAKYLLGRPRLVWHFCMQEQLAMRQRKSAKRILLNRRRPPFPKELMITVC